MNLSSVLSKLDTHLNSAGLKLNSLSYEPERRLDDMTMYAPSLPRAEAFPEIDVILSKDFENVEPSLRIALEGRIYHMVDLIGPFLADFARYSAFRLTFNISDQGGPNALSFDRPAQADWPLFPDLYLLAATPTSVSEAAFTKDFRARASVVFWRGATTGGTIRSKDDLFANYRVATCLRLRRELGDRGDCRVSRVTQLDGYAEDEAIAELRAVDIFGDYVPESRFAAYQMFIDLDGNTAAWGTCLKYLAGCLVLRPPSSRELYYSHLLKPWAHYIPIRSDMSDVSQRVSWAVDNPVEAAEIARRGQDLLADFVRQMPALIKATFLKHNVLRP